jgi:hypothetical protein
VILSVQQLLQMFCTLCPDVSQDQCDLLA